MDNLRHCLCIGYRSYITIINELSGNERSDDSAWG